MLKINTKEWWWQQWPAKYIWYLVISALVTRIFVDPKFSLIYVFFVSTNICFHLNHGFRLCECSHTFKPHLTPVPLLFIFLFIDFCGWSATGIQLVFLHICHIFWHWSWNTVCSVADTHSWWGHSQPDNFLLRRQSRYWYCRVHNCYLTGEQVIILDCLEVPQVSTYAHLTHSVNITRQIIGVRKFCFGVFCCIGM